MPIDFKPIDFQEEEKPAGNIDFIEDETPSKPPSKSIGGFARNVVSDTADIAKGIYGIVRHPIDTAQNVVDLGLGLADPYINAVLPKSTDPQQLEDEARRAKIAAPVQDLINRNISDPLGIPKRALESLYNKPVSGTMNASLGIGGLGKIVKAGGAARTAKALDKASNITNPISMASKGIVKGVQKLSDKASPILIKSAMKIPPSVSKDIIDKTIKTMREEGITVTEKGLSKNRTIIDSVNNEISTVIERGAKSGQTVDMQSVVSRIDSLKDFYKDYPRAKKYLDQLDEIKNDVLSQNNAQVPVDTAQKMKQRIYQINRKHYGDMKGAEVEADKAIARGLKEEIVKQNPELSKLNARDSALISLDEFLERSVNRIGNYNIVRLGDTVMAAGGLAAGGPHGAALAGTLMHLIDGPAYKSRLALALDRAKKIKPVPLKISNTAFQTQQLSQQGNDK
jgi:hypothetical protein